MEYHRLIPYRIDNGHSSSDNAVVILVDVDANMYVPLLVNSHDANDIMTIVNPDGDEKSIGLTLLFNVMKSFALEIEEVRIESMVEGIASATVLMTDGYNKQRIACSVGNAVVIALSNGVRMLIAKSVTDDIGYPIDDTEDLDWLNDMETTVQQPSLEELNQRLHECEQNEEYEEAARIQEQINQLYGDHNE